VPAIGPIQKLGTEAYDEHPWSVLMKQFVISALALFTLAAPVFAGENLKLNPKLDYTSDSQDGPLITGDSMYAGFVPGKPAYVMMYGEGCFNCKRQARRTVGLYEKYKGRVQLVMVDIDRPLPIEQQELSKKYFHGSSRTS
jgi:thiol-disulfide isomerase/thioredoxin